MKKPPGPKPGTPGHHRGGPKHGISQTAEHAMRRNPHLSARIAAHIRRAERLQERELMAADRFNSQPGFFPETQGGGKPKLS